MALIKLTAEEEVYKAVADYLRFTYQKLEFRFDYGAGATLFYRQAVVQKLIQKSKSWPDLFLAAPTVTDNPLWSNLHGFFLEIKPPGFKIFKKSGGVVNEHVGSQIEKLADLRRRGYGADIAVGTDESIRKLDEYLSYTEYKKRESWKK